MGVTQVHPCLPVGNTLSRPIAVSPFRPLAVSPFRSPLPPPKAGNNQEAQEHGCGEDE
jgi:hypothetical protein